MDWGSLIGGIGSAAGSYFAGNAYEGAGKIAAASAREARAQQQAQLDKLYGIAKPGIDAGNRAVEQLETATGLNGAQQQAAWANGLLDQGAFKSQQGFADAALQAKQAAQGGSTMGGNEISALRVQDQAGANAYLQQNVGNFQGLQAGGNQALGAIAYPTAGLAQGVAASTQNAGLHAGNGLIGSTNAWTSGVAGAIPGVLKGLRYGSDTSGAGGFSGSTAAA
jgi:hypothetical protein